MRSVAVVVVDVFAKEQSAMTLAEDEQPIQGFVTERLDHAPA